MHCQLIEKIEREKKAATVTTPPLTSIYILAAFMIIRAKKIRLSSVRCNATNEIAQKRGYTPNKFALSNTQSVLRTELTTLIRYVLRY